MTKSFGNPGRKPSRPGGSAPSGRGTPPDRKPAPGPAPAPPVEKRTELPNWAPTAQQGNSAVSRPRPQAQPPMQPMAQMPQMPPPQQQQQQYNDPYSRYDEQYDDGYGNGSNNAPNQNYQRTAYNANNPLDGQYDARVDEETGLKIDAGKRIVAVLLDFVVAYLLAVVIVMLPLINQLVVPNNLLMAVFLLIRDFLFGGRGVGKNFMGIRVVDAHSGQAPTILQSVLRNIVVLAPLLVIQTVPLLLKFIPFTSVTEAVMSLINIIGMIYVAIVLPLESYRVYSREDGLRIGDEIAGTKIVESAMDFSSPFPR